MSIILSNIDKLIFFNDKFYVIFQKNIILKFAYYKQIT